jgi:hypothetical protein
LLWVPLPVPVTFAGATGPLKNDFEEEAMSQFDGKNEITGNDSGADHVTDHGAMWDAIMSCHSGGSRPSYAQAGTIWRKSTASPQELYFYDGSQDILLAKVNFATHTVEWQGKVADALLLGGQNSAYHLARANHTGTQALSTVTGHTKTAHDALGIEAASLDMQGEAQAENGSGVFLVADTPTQIATIDVGTVSAGDRIFAEGFLWVLRVPDMGSGEMQLIIQKLSGTATIETYHDKDFLVQARWTPLAELSYLTVAGVLRVTGGGTLVLRLLGVSKVGDSQVGAGDGQFSVFFLRKQ